MRFVSMVFLMFLCVGLAPARGVLAANVLLPPDNSSGGGGANMGLVPAPDSESTPEPDTPKTKPVELPAEPVQPAPAPTPVQKPTSPQVSSSTIAITLAETSLWTPFDVNTISAQLGISKGMVHNECAIGVNGLLVTDQGTYTVESGVKTDANVTYSGSIMNSMLSTRAICQSAPQPAPGSYIQRSGRYFVVPLGSSYCVPRTTGGTYSRLLIMHAVGGKDTCAYQ